jgi:hypothetical protein
MSKITVISTLLLVGLAASAGVQAANMKPCFSTPDASATSNGQGQPSSSGVIADPGPCKISSNTKGPKSAKGSNNGNGQGNGNGSGNGQGSDNGQGSNNGQGSDNGQGDSSDESKIKQGLAIAPVPLNLQGRNRALVAIGSYIVNAQGACNDCHTWPNFAANGDPYRGQPKTINASNYLAGGRPFGPFLRSRNLTPKLNETDTEQDRYAEFVKVMRTGWDPDQAHTLPPISSSLLQVMPWPVYQDMTDRDLRAIFEYLQAIPHADPYCTGANPPPVPAICLP